MRWCSIRFERDHACRPIGSRDCTSINAVGHPLTDHHTTLTHLLHPGLSMHFNTAGTRVLFLPAPTQSVHPRAGRPRSPIIRSFAVFCLRPSSWKLTWDGKVCMKRLYVVSQLSLPRVQRDPVLAPGATCHLAAMWETYLSAVGT